MRFHLYSYGYQGGTLADLQAYAAVGAVILDTRLNPRSPNPMWRKGALEKALGSQYRWCQALGNVNYRSGGPIQLRNWVAGWATLRQLLDQGPVVLLCACRVAAECHRSTVAALAQNERPGLPVLHLAAGDGLAEVDGLPSGPEPIKAITLWQPWASAMAVGAKHIETRSWPAEKMGVKPGELLAIHAAARPIPRGERAEYEEAVRTLGLTLDTLPYSAVLCVVRYLESRPTTEYLCGQPYDMDWLEDLSPNEARWGNYGQDRYGWVTELVHVFPEPISAKGAQGVWRWAPPEGCSWPLEARAE